MGALHRCANWMGGVVRLVLRGVAVLLLVGAAIGAGVSIWVSRFVGALLVNVDARDPIVFAASAALLVAAGRFAGWLSARRASQMDPSSMLRG